MDIFKEIKFNANDMKLRSKAENVKIYSHITLLKIMFCSI